jgi:hypothetical protein
LAFQRVPAEAVGGPRERGIWDGQAVDGPFTRGPLAYLLRNRVHIGEVVFTPLILTALTVRVFAIRRERS